MKLESQVYINLHFRFHKPHPKKNHYCEDSFRLITPLPIVVSVGAFQTFAYNLFRQSPDGLKNEVLHGKNRIC